MKIEHKVFKLGSESGKDLKKSDTLLLVIGGTITDILVKDVFVDYEQRGTCIVGYSILSTFAVSGDGTLKKDGKSICFKSNSELVGIKAITNPAFKLPSKTFNIAQIDDFNTKVTINKPVETSTSETPPTESEEKIEETKATLLQEYEEDKKPLIELGYQEYLSPEYPNIKILYKEGEKPYMVNITDKEVESVAISNIVPSSFDFVYNNKKQTAKIEGGKLLITQ
jgi:hypothetical protein